MWGAAYHNHYQEGNVAESQQEKSPETRSNPEAVRQNEIMPSPASEKGRLVKLWGNIKKLAWLTTIIAVIAGIAEIASLYVNLIETDLAQTREAEVRMTEDALALAVSEEATQDAAANATVAAALQAQLDLQRVVATEQGIGIDLEEANAYQATGTVLRRELEAARATLELTPQEVAAIAISASTSTPAPTETSAPKPTDNATPVFTPTPTLSATPTPIEAPETAAESCIATEYFLGEASNRDEIFPIVPGGLFAGTITESNDVQSFRYEATTDALVVFRVDPDLGFNPRLDVFDEFNNLVESRNSVGDGRIESVLLIPQANSTFTFVVSGVSGDMGRYEVSLTTNDTLAPIAPDESCSGQILVEGRFDEYRFQAIADENITIRAEPSDGFNLYLTVLDEFRNVLADRNSVGNGKEEIITFTPRFDGTFIIVVSGVSSLGTYEVRLAKE